MLKDNKIYKFFGQVKQEAKKISWPTKKELYVSLVIVIIAVLLFSIVVVLVDYFAHNFVHFLLNFGK